jgi:hypothetical protein
MKLAKNLREIFKFNQDLGQCISYDTIFCEYLTKILLQIKILNILIA